MLASLRIRNLALVEDVEWTLAGGFLAVTGETGSGKSIIIGALKLLLGERADKSLIRTGAESCTVEGVFQLDDPAALNERLVEHGVEPCTESELIVKRAFSLNGASRQFLNCSPTTLAVLKSTCDPLVDLHGPHEHQSLLAVDQQLALLDSYAGAGGILAEYQKLYRTINRITAEHAALAGSEAELARELDLLRHQVQEIERANLRPEEEESILARYRVAQNSKRLAELTAQIIHRLGEADDAVLAQAAEVQRALREIERIDPSFAPLTASHAAAVVELEEVARSVQRYADQLDLDGDQLASLEERVTLIETFKRKYGGSIAAVIEFGESAAARLHRIESREDELKRLEAELSSARDAMMKVGTQLTKKRAGAAPKLAAAVAAQLRDLGFKKSGFEIALTPLENPGGRGLVAVEFLFAPNPGEPLKPLKSVASSGEISRVMLALKTALAAQDTVPLLVFDEIDANVGGEIAHAVGAKMKSLGEAHQVLCITHLPQVAALAATQFVVTKDSQDDRTTSRIVEVVGQARVEEIARMLGGRTDSALAHAVTLLRQQ